MSRLQYCEHLTSASHMHFFRHNFSSFFDLKDKIGIKDFPNNLCKGVQPTFSLFKEKELWD